MFIYDYIRKTRNINIIRQSELFDSAWYKKRYMKWYMTNPAKHYYNQGWKKGYNPSKYFDTKAYLSCNQDVAETGVNPLYHYVLYGKEEFRLIRCVE